MKRLKQPVIDELLLDIVEYAFVEWLRRRGVFYAFRSNCGFDQELNSSFRTVLRHRIQRALRSSDLCIGDLISMSFIFVRTPEGVTFWFDLSFAWRRFCTNIQNNFK